MAGSNCAVSYESLILTKGQPTTPPVPPNQDMVRHMGAAGSFLTTGSGLAAKSPLFRRVFDSVVEKVKMRNALMADHEDLFRKIMETSPESKAKVNAVLEYLRLAKKPIAPTGRSLSIKTRDIVQEGQDGVQRTARPALSKPGDVLSLNKEETALLFEIRDYLDNRFTLNAKSTLAALGYEGEYSRDAITALPEDEMRDEFLRLYDTIESQRLTSYIPFMRSGDVRVMVHGHDGSLESGGFFMLESRAWLKNLVGPRFERLIPENDLRAQIEEIRRRFPEKDGFKVQVTRFTGDPNKRLNISDLGSMDKILGLMDATSGEMVKRYMEGSVGGLVEPGMLDDFTKAHSEAIARGFVATLPKNVRAELMKQVAANFMKQSRNIPGYDTNFLDRLLDYNRIVASTVADRTYRRQTNEGMGALRHKAEEPERRYAERWIDYVDTPEHALWRGARAIGFYNAMWGSFSSSFVNAMSVWTTVAPQMTVMNGSAGLDIYKMSASLITAMRGNPRLGMVIDPAKIRGITEDQRAALIRAIKRGTVAAQVNPELMGIEAGFLASKGGDAGKLAQRWFQIGSSVVTVTEELNKYAAFLTAYKYAQDPKSVEKWKKAYGWNQRAKAIMKKGSDPYDIAEFMTETVTFMGGNIEKPPIMRGAGGVVFQFAQYPLQLTKLLYNNFAKMGPDGKIAGIATIAMMNTMAGLLFAFPFGDDAINIFDYIMEIITGRKSNFRLETQEALAAMLGGDDAALRDAEMLLYGPTRRITGLDIGQRVGFTSMLPELNDPVSAIPALSVTIGKFNEYRSRMRNGEDIGAMIALLSPAIGKAPTDVLRGLVQFPNEGYRTRMGGNVKPPEKMDAYDTVGRALGFQSADLARSVRARWTATDINSGTRDAERALTVRLSKTMAEAIKAGERGDTKAEARLQAEFDAEYQSAADAFMKKVDEGKIQDGIRPPSNQALREAIMIELNPEMRITQFGKNKRDAILEAQRVIMMEDDDGELYGDEAAPMEIAP